MNIHSIQNHLLQFDLRHEGDKLDCQVTVKSTGLQSPWVPLLLLEVYDRMQERVDRVSTVPIAFLNAEGDQVLHASLRDPQRGVTVGLWIRLDEAGLCLRFPPSEIEEAGESLYRVFAVNLLSGLVRTGSDGKVLMPLCSGVVFSPLDKPALSDRFLIYGEQERWELLPTMPICAALGESGGWISIATNGAEDTYCSVATDGNGSATIGLHPMLRRHWCDPVDWTTREIRIEPILPGTDIILAAADRLRRHVAEDIKKPTLKHRAAESPQCAYQQSAYTMKLFHGLQQQGIIVDGRGPEAGKMLFRRSMSFAEAEKNLLRLKKAGVERIYWQSVGWNPKGHDGAWPTDFPIEERLGGEQAFRQLIQSSHEMGFHSTVHLNTVMVCFQSPDFQADWVLHDIWGEPKLTGVWGGGPHSSHWGLAIPEEVLRKRFEKIKQLGLNGMLYLDFMGNPLYANHHPVHRGPRAHYAQGIRRFLDLGREYFGGVQTEMGYLYAATHCDALAGGPGSPWHLQHIKPEWPVSALIEEIVPVWNLAMHEFVTMENQSIGWESTMRCLLMGQVPRDEWAASPGLFPVLDDARIEKIRVRYELCCEKFGHLIPEQLVSWKKCADGVEETQFADGTEVSADFSTGRLAINGQQIPKPHCYPDA